jgi:hypothetical protein
MGWHAPAPAHRVVMQTRVFFPMSVASHVSNGDLAHLLRLVFDLAGCGSAHALVGLKSSSTRLLDSLV